MKKNLIFQTLAILAGVCAGFIIAECAARVMMPTALYFPRVDLRRVEWKKHNGAVLWNKRRKTIENPALNDAKHGPSFRIVGLGDSIMFGSGIDSKDTYMSRLDGKLEEITGLKTESLDLSQAGYNLQQEAAVFDLEAGKVKPSLIIIHSWEDDLANYIVVDRVVWDADVYTETGVVRAIPLPLSVNQFLIFHSRLYQYLSLQAMKHKMRRNKYTIQRNRETFNKAIDSIYKNALKSDAKLLILLSPRLPDGKIKPINNCEIGFYCMMVEWSRNHNDVDVIDLSRKLAGVNGEEIKKDSVHFNKKGHDIMLDIIAKHISNRYLKK